MRYSFDYSQAQAPSNRLLTARNCFDTAHTSPSSSALVRTHQLFHVVSALTAQTKKRHDFNYLTANKYTSILNSQNRRQLAYVYRV